MDEHLVSLTPPPTMARAVGQTEQVGKMMALTAVGRKASLTAKLKESGLARV
jgi:hypothetical protein